MSLLETDPIRLIGPIFVGNILHWCLLGSLTVQLYTFSLDRRRSRYIRALVYSVYALDIVQTVFETDYAWKTLVRHWGDPSIFIKEPRSSFSISLMNGLISAIVQIFFAWRVWLLNPTITGKLLAVIITVLAVTQCVSATVATIQFLHVDNWEHLRDFTPGFTVWLAGSVAADVLIAVCMVSIFRKARKHSPFARTETLLTKLIVNTIETGAVTAVVTIIELVLFLVFPSLGYHKTPAFILGKLYSNVLLANLNTRNRNRHLVQSGVNSDLRPNGTTKLRFASPEDALSTTMDDHIQSSYDSEALTAEASEGTTATNASVHTLKDANLEDREKVG